MASYHLISFTFFSFLIFIFIPIGNAVDDIGKPSIIDSNLKAEIVFRGLDFPTTMAFIGPNDILVLEKDKGTVQRITDGKISAEPLLDLNVSYMKERGMLGIAVSENQSADEHKHIFLYYTKSQTNDDDKIFNETYWVNNYLYRYELVNDSKLSNPKLLLSTAQTNEPWHNGGDLLIGPDKNVYLVVGDHSKGYRTQAQNVRNATLTDLSSGILRVTQNGDPVGEGILGNEDPLNLYYAYGIRNSFGIDFDPVTGKLWDEENGKDCCDEINLVEPGFNSGWSKVQGIWETTSDLQMGNMVVNPNNLIQFDGKGKYSAPEFVWKESGACPSAIKFLDSDKYGKEYKNDLFVGNNKGTLWHFDLDKDRKALVLEGPLKDKVADTNTDDELSQVKFGDKFGGITDIQVGPYDGLLYILSLDGTIYKIVPQ